MQRLTRLIDLLPELLAAELLNVGGGSIAVRGSDGIYLTPTQASRELRWNLSAADFVLFPGGGEASMARAGRQPSRENRLHRAVLGALPEWNCTLLSQGYGLLGFALAGKPLRVPAAHTWQRFRVKPLELPVIHHAADPAELAEAVATRLSAEFGKEELGAALIEDFGPIIAGAEPEAVLALAANLETLARAQMWHLINAG